ncbi:hypothetical protein HS141_11630 [Cetobacterium somerae]|uniref:hypothetical protein n=2 Tax=Cetobacterium TaxID=180162 RepID=UPI00211F0E41|nr:hypothetical protein [Cetobacterium somerae]MCQ9627578.1 hypothetical protein [Cetobacterium somerae]
MKNFLRYSRIQLKDGTIIDSDQYNLRFEVDRTLKSNGNMARIELFYINDDTFNLFKKEDEIQLSAGYKKGVIGLIFNGNIDSVEKERDSVVLLCTESNEKMRNTIVNESFTPDTRVSTVVKKIIESNDFKIGKLFIENDYKYYGGKYFTESFKDSLDKISTEVNCIWYEKKGLIYFHPKDYDPDITFVTANSGLLEFNKNNDDGYIMITKLNHMLDEGNKVEVEYEENKKIMVIIENTSHYSDDFITQCEVRVVE